MYITDPYIAKKLYSGHYMIGSVCILKSVPQDEKCAFHPVHVTCLYAADGSKDADEYQLKVSLP